MAHHPAGLPPALSLVLASAFWGVATVIAKALLEHIPALTFLLIQLVPSVCVLWGIVLLSRRSLPRRRLWLILLLGVLNPGMAYTLSMLGLTMTTASVATLLWAAEPAMIVVAAWLLLREAVTLRFLAATLVAMGGVVLVSGIADAVAFTSDGAFGVLLILGGVACCALYTVLSRRIAAEIDPLPTVALQQTAGLVWVLAILPLQTDSFGGGAPLDWTVLLGGAVSGLMYYAAAFWCYLSALRAVEATRASIFLNLTPLFGVAAAFVFLGERLSPLQWAGGATIMLAVMALLTWARVRREHAA